MPPPSAAISVSNKESLENLTPWAKPYEPFGIGEQRLYSKHPWILGMGLPERTASLINPSVTPYEPLGPECSTAITAEIETYLVLLSKNRISIIDAVLVRDYLLRYPDMIDLVVSVCETALERFSARAQLSLEVYRDPEIEDEYLTLYVRQEPYDESILSIIEDVRARYAEDMAERSGWLLITTDFCPPR